MQHVTSLRTLGLAAAAVLALHSPVAAAKLDPALATFFSKVNAAVTSLSGKTSDQAYSACYNLMRSLVDIDVVAAHAATAASVRMTPRQRANFKAALERRAARNCASQNMNNNGKPLTLLGVRQGSHGDQLLATEVGQNGGAPQTAIWRIPDGSARAVDLLVNGQSMVLSLSKQFADILGRSVGGIDAAIKAFGN